MYVRGEEKYSNCEEGMIDDYMLDLPMVCDMKKGEELSCEQLRVPLLVNKDDIQSEKKKKIAFVLRKVVYILELPLDIPRKLTIPNVSQEKWSKPFGVVSITLAPLLLILIWDFIGPKRRIWAYGISGLIGLACGVVVFFTSDGLNPPKKFNFLWLGLGFLMSITWTYILAEELISLLVSMGLILGISPSILGLTVLAWGNSLGDLVANVTLAKSGGPRGAQVALCGCYAGPIFNTLVGLGLSHFPNLESISLNPSILGLTVLAWGNSLGDLVANVTLAESGGPRRAQVALCGCYVGPIFNTLVGLGLSHFHNLESISLKLYSAN
ncbi:Cation/calcium exchanger 1 [Capsicum chinense]|nr:Cation/calcium exchanger 1 [Capsicum chinense]